MSERTPQGRFQMKFVGYKDGALIPRAPGNYAQGQVVELPFRHSKYAWWELVEEVPTDVVPEATPEESVFEEVAEEEEEGDMPAQGLMEQEPLGSLRKRELVSYIRQMGGRANMSMKLAELRSLASELGYPY